MDAKPVDAATRVALSHSLSYDPTSGVVTWATRSAFRIRVGDPAGTMTRFGYLRFEFGGRSFAAHRVAWLLMTGDWSDGPIDHIDGDRSNNRRSNLRLVDRYQNAQNQRRAQRHSKTGELGVWQERGRFRAGIRVNGKLRNLGSFDDAQSAGEAYRKAKSELHPGYVGQGS